jgi:hypothetical protein
MEFSSSNQDITILRNSITQSQYIFNNKDRPVLYCNDDKVLNRVLNLVNQNVCIYNLNLFIATQRGAIKTVIYLLENCRYFTLDDYANAFYDGIMAGTLGSIKCAEQILYYNYNNANNINNIYDGILKKTELVGNKLCEKLDREIKFTRNLKLYNDIVENKVIFKYPIKPTVLDALTNAKKYTNIVGWITYICEGMSNEEILYQVCCGLPEINISIYRPDMYYELFWKQLYDRSIQGDIQIKTVVNIIEFMYMVHKVAKKTKFNNSSDIFRYFNNELYKYEMSSQNIRNLYLTICISCYEKCIIIY